MRESLLDDCPGMGPSKKQALLAAFGSVERLRKRTPGEIATLPGISMAFARTLVAWLADR